MKLCDSNVWLALLLGCHSQHEAVRGWMEIQERAASVMLCRAVQQSLLRLLSTSAVLGAYGLPPLTNEEAWEVFRRLGEDDRIVFTVAEPPGLESVWEEFSRRPSASPKLWMDAYLAAFARTGNHQLVTLDGAYRQFVGVDLLVLEQA